MTVTYEVGESSGGGHLDVDFYVCHASERSIAELIKADRKGDRTARRGDLYELQGTSGDFLVGGGPEWTVYVLFQQ